MIRKALIALPLLLAACVADDRSTGSFRPEDAPIWSAAAFDATLLAGDWRQVAGFSDRRHTCRAGALRFQPSAGGLRMSGSLCLNGRLEKLKGRAEVTGPGRLSIGGEEWWILWVDSDYRTLAIGTPSGRFGMILDRGAIPPDRYQAAREVFDFNGYLTDALQAF